MALIEKQKYPDFFGAQMEHGTLHEKDRSSSIYSFETVVQLFIFTTVLPNKTIYECTETRELVLNSFSAIYYHLAKQSFLKVAGNSCFM